ncbi:chemotaxis protein [Marinobacterium iners]|nr:PAS domain-containing methyl-accepting chemotaxis protein [Marinobacterium iners]QSR35314.1 chemotaxis protein [Marinobacterium iners]
MRNNLPVTQKERRFGSDEKLISTTDLDGNITHCNDVFVNISGYSREELIGQPHNMVRHPDMPEAAFKVLWDTIRAGKPWMGLVKNRCKNGDHYWVNAYVTPITEHGKVIGFESVRVCPERADVARAEKIYGLINRGKSISKFSIPWDWVIFVVALVLAGVLGNQVSPLLGGALFAVVAAALLANQQIQRQRRLNRLLNMMPSAFKHPVATATYTDSIGSFGDLEVAIKSEQSHLDTVLTRIDDAALSVADKARSGLEMSQESCAAMRRQQEETEKVAAAMHQMASTIAEVSGHVQETASQAERSNTTAVKGRELASTTSQSIAHLSQTVNHIASSVQDLVEQTGKIADAARIIEEIADQTNLLALNAAIEAARAGEHGRGFAVVADEVRQLAMRTQASTRDIHQIVDELGSRADHAIKAAHEGQDEADAGLAQVQEAEQMLNEISGMMSTIANMSMQMAAAVEEQAQVSEGVNAQVASISALSSESLFKAEEAAGTTRELQSVSADMHELVSGFKR